MTLRLGWTFFGLWFAFFFGSTELRAELKYQEGTPKGGIDPVMEQLIRTTLQDAGLWRDDGDRVVSGVLKRPFRDVHDGFEFTGKGYVQTSQSAEPWAFYDIYPIWIVVFENKRHARDAFDHYMDSRVTLRQFNLGRVKGNIIDFGTVHYAVWTEGRFLFQTYSKFFMGKEYSFEDLARTLYMNVHASSLLGKPQSQGVRFTLKVQKDGFEPETTFFETKDYAPSRIEIRGNVVDDVGNPIPEAIVSIKELQQETTTDIGGAFLLTANTQGTKPFEQKTTIRLKSIGTTSMKIDLPPVIPIPGECSLRVTATDRKTSKPSTGSVHIELTDEAGKKVLFARVAREEAAGFMLDRNGTYTTKIKTVNPGEGGSRWDLGYTYLRQVPLKAKIAVRIEDKGRVAGRAEKTVPFNLALVSGTTADERQQVVKQRFAPKPQGFPSVMNIKQETDFEGHFWVLVKPIHPTNKKTLRQICEKAHGFYTLAWKLDIMPLIYQVEEYPDPGDNLDLGKVGKTPLESIRKWYKAFGATPITWPDGTHEKTPLWGPSPKGTMNNLLEWGTEEAKRYNCVSMAYKTLYFLHQIATREAENPKAKYLTKLKGWDFDGAAGNWFTPGKYPNWVPGIGGDRTTEHNAVVLWDVARRDWDTTIPRVGVSGTYILDAHPNQRPQLLPSDDILFPFELLPNKREHYIDTNWKPPWPKPSQPAKKKFRSDTLIAQCPVDLLLTNDAGQRVGLLPNGEWVFEFALVDFYFWQIGEFDRAWFVALPEGEQVHAEVRGVADGSMNLLATSDGLLHDFGDIPVSTGDQGTVTMGASGIGVSFNDVQKTPTSSLDLPTFLSRHASRQEPQSGRLNEMAQDLLGNPRAVVFIAAIVTGFFLLLTPGFRKTRWITGGVLICLLISSLAVGSFVFFSTRDKTTMSLSDMLTGMTHHLLHPGPQTPFTLDLSTLAGPIGWAIALLITVLALRKTGKAFLVGLLSYWIVWLIESNRETGFAQVTGIDLATVIVILLVFSGTILRFFGAGRRRRPMRHRYDDRYHDAYPDHHHGNHDDHDFDGGDD